MSELTVPIRGAEMAVTRLDGSDGAAHSLVWAHGWGQSGQAFLGLAQSFSRMYPSSVVDFPGFGRSKPPPGTWGTADYADAIAEWLRSLSPQSLIWIGHSFGCRVGLQIAARHPGLLRGMILIAAAGLPRQRNDAKSESTAACSAGCSTVWAALSTAGHRWSLCSTSRT